MDGRNGKRDYILTGRSGGRVVVPPRQQDQGSFAIPTAPIVQQAVGGKVGAATTSAMRPPVAPLANSATSSQTPPATASPGAPYDRRHLPTSNPEPAILNNPTISFSATPIGSNVGATTGTMPDRTVNTIGQQAVSSAVRNGATTTGQPVQGGVQNNVRNNTADAKRSTQSSQLSQSSQPTMTEAERRYHQAWQSYYQKYYQNYYIAALQEQQARFARQQAEVVDSREPDGKLSQTEVQERIQSDILTKVKQAAGRAKKRWWFWPVIVAIVVIIIFLFLQYNSVIVAKIAGFISPGSSDSQTIIVGTGANQPVSDGPRIIIPKINVNAPVTYGLTSLDESAVQTALQNGPINYPVAGATATPGQRGNTVILGHSSADVFAPGDYKFIFVQLNRLTAGDLFYLDYGAKRYTYKVTELKVIDPTDVAALNLGTDKPYATLVTCDPPGTTAQRLLVIAEQVSPNPDGADEVQADDASNTPASITGKPKTLLESIFGG